MKFLLTEVPPLSARGAAGITAAFGVGLLAVLTGQGLRVPRPLIGRLVLGGFTNVFAWMGFTTLSLRWLGAGQAALLVYTMPVWAMLLAWPMLGRRPTGRSIAGLLLSMSGLAVLFGGGQLEVGAALLPGALLALAAAFLFAFGTVLPGPAASLPPLTSLAWQLAIGCLPMLVLGLWFEDSDPRALSPLGWTLMAYMTVVPMCVCYLTWFAALRRLPAATASVATLLTPVIGIGAAALTLGEPFGGKEILAIVLTLGGVALVLRRP